MPYVQKETFEIYDENVHGIKKWEMVEGRASITSQSSEGNNPYSMTALAATTASDVHSESGLERRSFQYSAGAGDDKAMKSPDNQIESGMSPDFHKIDPSESFAADYDHI